MTGDVPEQRAGKFRFSNIRAYNSKVMKHTAFRLTFAAVAGFVLSSMTRTAVAGAQSTFELSAFVGRWQLNPSMTHMGRFGPAAQNMVRSPTFTFVFARDGKNLQNNVYAEYPQSAPTRTMSLIPDGRAHPCQEKGGCLTVGGNPKEQSYIYRKINDHFLVRLFLVKGETSEYTTYAVSANSKTFTMISWSAQTPFFQNIQVFDRQP
jgi:hypothetical protein